MKKIISIILIILLIAAGILLVKKRKKAMRDAPRAIPVTYTVRTISPQIKTVSQRNPFLAKLEPRQYAIISTKLSGQIINMQVSENQAVNKGELLLQIDDREINANIMALQSNLTAAKKQLLYTQNTHRRNKVLFDAGGLPQEKLDASAVAVSTANSAEQSLQQQIQGLKSQLEYTKIIAPFSGSIGTVFLQQGNLAVPGKPILSLNSDSQKLTFILTPDSNGIKKMQDVLFEEKKIGNITKLYNDARNSLQVAEVELDQHINQPNGSYLTIQVITKTVTGCSVPLQSLLHRPQKTSVLRYKDNHFEEVTVSIMAQDKNFAVIKPALSLPVAVAAEAKLSLLPTAQGTQVIKGENNE